MALAVNQGLKSLAFPIIGSGSGSFSQSKALELMLDELSKLNADIRVVVVKYQKH